MVALTNDFQKALSSLKDPEIADDWNEFMKFVKSYRAHVFLGGIAVTGVGLFTSVYALAKMKDHQLPIGIVGLITTLLGVGIAVDTGEHLYYG